MDFITWRELLFAIVFAIICAVIVDALDIGSALRTGVRRIRNRLSERSMSRLRRRIAELEKYRDSVNSYASSDKALYLVMFRFVLVTLMFMCMGATTLVVDLIFKPHSPIALFCTLEIFAFSIIVAAQGVKIAGWILDRRFLRWLQRLMGK
jgi:hypothetical protein